LAIERWDMFKEIAAIHEEVDRIFQDFFRRIPSPRVEELTSFTPPVNVYDDADKIVIAIALPGMKKEDIDISMQDRTLTISGVRIGSDKPYYQQEWQYGHFERDILLPIAINSDDILAEYTDGILTISIPKEGK
jgi:HSP20 family protein